MKHRNGPECPKCVEFFKECSPELYTFALAVRGQFMDAHISCAWRNRMHQWIAYRTGKSKVKWPSSKHNRLQDDKPSSDAVDFFRLDDTGKAKFEESYYRKIAMFQRDWFPELIWGGTWKMRDYPHWELKR